MIPTTVSDIINVTMEARRPPPKAEHPFPDRVELWRKWGTPAAKAFWKAGFIVVPGTCIFMYSFSAIRDKDRGPYGITLRTQEEYDKGVAISQVPQSLRFFPNMTPNVNPSDPIGAILFDDGRQFVPPGPKVSKLEPTG